jgi:hypothetical protein
MATMAMATMAMAMMAMAMMAMNSGDGGAVGELLESKWRVGGEPVESEWRVSRVFQFARGWFRKKRFTKKSPKTALRREHRRCCYVNRVLYFLLFRVFSFFRICASLA